MRSETRYIGPVDGRHRQPKTMSGLSRRSRRVGADDTRDDEARIAYAVERSVQRIDAEQRARYGETAVERQDRERQESLADLHDRFGLRVDNPPPAPAAPPATARSEESPSDDAEGQDFATGAPDPGTAAGQNS